MTETAEELKRERYGPALMGGSRRDRFHGGRLLGYLTAFVVLAMLAVGATVGSLAWVGTTSIDRVDISAPGAEGGTSAAVSESEFQLAEVSGVTNLLLVGSDSRDGLTDDELLALGTRDEGASGLTDTLMLVQLDGNEHDVSVLSFPRDLLVEHCDGTRGRINAAFRYGEQLQEQGKAWTGPSCLVETVRSLVGITIHHYVQVDFQGFMEAVDAVGGVTFHIDEPIRDVSAGVDLQPGCVTFDGAKALGFVRARHVDSDFGRIARQQRFLRELVAKSTSVETLANPTRTLALVRAVSGAVTTDEELGTMEMASLAYTFRELTNEGIETYVVPGVDRKWNGADVLELQEPQADELFERFRDGSIGSPASEPGTGSPSAADPAAGTGSPSAADPAAGTGSPSAADPTPGGSEVPGSGGTAPEAADPTPAPTFKNAQLSDVAC